MKIQPIYEKCNPEAAQDLQTATAYLMKVMQIMIENPESLSGSVITEVMTLGKSAIDKSISN